MSNNDRIYAFRDGFSPEDARASVMLVSLGGFVDAGHTQRLLAAHLLSHHDHELVASFDVDQLVDYRSRRPTMVFERDHYTSYDAPTIELHRVHDLDGTPFLMLTGVEPDYQWDRVVAAVQELISDLGVDLTVMAHGVPMGVPHTRPIGATAHATNPSLIAGESSPFEKVLVPGSIEALLELRLGEAGRNVIGYSVHVPHYLAQMPMPGASLAVLDRIAGATGLRLERAELEGAAAHAESSLREELGGREDVAQIVAALEQQYDAYVGAQRLGLPAGEDTAGAVNEGPMPSADELPSADEIAAEAEAFLRALDD